MSANFLAASSKATYARYVCVAESIMKNKTVPLLVVSLAVDVSVVNAPRISPVHETGFLISIKKDIHLMIQAPDTFLINDHKPATFQYRTFYPHLSALFHEFHVRDMD